jgi:hypothetical protein
MFGDKNYDFMRGPRRTSARPATRSAIEAAGGDLRRLLFIHGCFDWADFRDFFLLVIVERGMNEADHTEDQKENSEDDDEALHVRKLITGAALCVRNASGDTTGPFWRSGVLSGLEKFGSWLTNGWLRQRRQLSWRPWRRWRPCGGAWSWAAWQELRRSIRPS